MDAIFHHGSPLMVDHTPSGADVEAGDVVVVGDLPLVAHLDIADGKTGALAAGGGVYQVTAGGAAAAGKKVYWDAANGKVTTSAASGANKVFGYVAPESAAAADGDKIYAIHRPEAT